MGPLLEFDSRFDVGFRWGASCWGTAEHNENRAKRMARGRQAQFSRRLPSISLNIDRTAGSGGQIVAMVQTAEFLHYHDPAAWFGPVRCLATGRCSLRQRKVSPVFMVIVDVLKHKPFQVAFIENDHVVEQIAAAVTDPAFRNAVLPWTSEAGPLGLDAECLHGIDHFAIELCAAIKDQVSGSRVVGEGFAQLLNHPGASRMFGHIGGWPRSR